MTSPHHCPPLVRVWAERELTGGKKRDPVGHTVLDALGVFLGRCLLLVLCKLGARLKAGVQG